MCWNPCAELSAGASYGMASSEPTVGAYEIPMAVNTSASYDAAKSSESQPAYEAPVQQKPAPAYETPVTINPEYAPTERPVPNPYQLQVSSEYAVSLQDEEDYDDVATCELVNGRLVRKNSMC